jgi:hypothetical protein
MLEGTLKGFYDKLKPIAEKSKRYSKVSRIVVILLIIIYAVVSLISAFIPIFQNLDRSISASIGVLIWGILFILTMRVLGRKSRKYHLTVDEWSIFLACSILKNLQQYSEASKRQNQELEKEYKNMAVQDAKDLLSTVENGWEIGDFQLAKKIFNGTISKFKENLQTKLVPNLEKLNKETFDKVQLAVYNITHFILNPSLPGLNHLNDSTFQQLTEYPLSKAKFLSRWWNYLQVHRVQKHTLVLTGIGILAFSTFIICRSLGASIDTTLINTFFILGTLAAAYIATVFIKRESPRTTESK